MSRFFTISRDEDGGIRLDDSGKGLTLFNSVSALAHGYAEKVVSGEAKQAKLDEILKLCRSSSSDDTEIVSLKLEIQAIISR